MWLISFYTKSLNRSHSLSHRMRLACEMTLMLFIIKLFLGGLTVSSFILSLLWLLPFSDSPSPFFWFNFLPSFTHSFTRPPYRSVKGIIKKKSTQTGRLTDGIDKTLEWDMCMLGRLIEQECEMKTKIREWCMGHQYHASWLLRINYVKHFLFHSLPLQTRWLSLFLSVAWNVSLRNNSWDSQSYALNC